MANQAIFIGCSTMGRAAHSYLACRPVLPEGEIPSPRVNMTGRDSSIPRTEDDTDSDRLIIARCRAGDHAAFKGMVERYQKRVYGIAFGMLHSSADAMDITQEVFIRVHQYLKHFKGSSSFYTWIYRIAFNLCIDHLRKEAKSNQTVDYNDALDHDYGEEAGDLLSTSLDMNPARVLDRKEQSEMIQQALQTLSPNHRAVLLMREVEGLSYSEMAEVMQCNKGTIMSRLFHARRRMQDALLARMGEKK